MKSYNDFNTASDEKLNNQRKVEKQGEVLQIVLWVIIFLCIIVYTFTHTIMMENKKTTIENKNKAIITTLYDIAKAETHSYSVVDINNDSICNILLRSIVEKAKAQNIKIYSASINSTGLYVTYASEAIILNRIEKDVMVVHKFDLNTLNIEK